VAAFATVSQAFFVPSAAPSAATRTRGVMQMLKVRRCESSRVYLVDRVLWDGLGGRAGR
jgi:hypothetical protein